MSMKIVLTENELFIDERVCDSVRIKELLNGLFDVSFFFIGEDEKTGKPIPIRRVAEEEVINYQGPALKLYNVAPLEATKDGITRLFFHARTKADEETKEFKYVNYYKIFKDVPAELTKVENGGVVNV